MENSPLKLPFMIYPHGGMNTELKLDPLLEPCIEIRSVVSERWTDSLLFLTRKI